MSITEHLANATVVKGLEQFWHTKQYSYRTSPRPDNGFLLVKKGTLVYSFPPDSLTAIPGDLIFLPAASHYEAVFQTEKGPVETVLVNFVLPICQDLPTTPVRILQNAPEALQTALWKTISAARASLPFLTQSQFYLFCHLLEEQLEEGPGEGALIRKAKALLEDPGLSLDDVARKLLISPSGLRKKFKDATGISPMEYRKGKQLEQCRDLLRYSDLTIEEIAQRCRFYDAAHFCREFKKRTGLSPGQYRERHSSC